MGKFAAIVALFAVIAFGVAGYAGAQDGPTGTPGADFCATPDSSPDASPGASPEATPEIITDASPAAVATSVVANIEGGLADTVCGTPDASPSA